MIDPKERLEKFLRDKIARMEIDLARAIEALEKELADEVQRHNNS